MKHLHSIKEVQQLTERTASLSQFIYRSTEKYLSFFKILRHIKDFTWSDECRAAFDDLKKYLESAPLLSKLVEGEELFIYLSILANVVSSILVRSNAGT